MTDTGTTPLDVSVRSRLSGLDAIQVPPVVLAQGTLAAERVAELFRSINQAVTAGITRIATLGAPEVSQRSEAIGRAQSLSTRSLTDVAPWYDYILGRFGEMASDDDDVCPNRSVLSSAWAEANSLFGPSTPTPSVVPSESDGVAFVWHKRGWDIQVEVTPLEATVWAYRRDDGDEWYGPLADNRGRLTLLLNDLANE